MVPPPCVCVIVGGVGVSLTSTGTGLVVGRTCGGSGDDAGMFILDQENGHFQINIYCPRGHLRIKLCECVRVHMCLLGGGPVRHGT